MKTTVQATATTYLISYCNNQIQKATGQHILHTRAPHLVTDALSVSMRHDLHTT